MIQTLVALTLAMVSTGIGNILMRRGMLTVGALQSYKPNSVFPFFFRAVKNRWVILGVIAHIFYFFLWLIVLSWADVSWALPMNAMEYVLVAFLALLILKEKISRERWIGIALISVGMFFMIFSW